MLRRGLLCPHSGWMENPFMTEHTSDARVSSATRVAVPLDPTGVPGLDEVLGGGIQRGSLAILAGPPGSGKTILAHQIAFTAARAGQHTVVLTAFSEPTNKLISHMRPFTFFDQELLGQSLDVLSVQQVIRQGLASATDEIVATVRSARAALVVLDGFRAVRETADHPEDARRFIYDVSNRLNVLGITLLLTGEANVRDTEFFPEATTADVLIGLGFDAIDAQERRTLEVLKVRGAVPLLGRHALMISNTGATVYPRLEARVARSVGVPHDPAALSVPSHRPHSGNASALPFASDTAADAGQTLSDLVATGTPGLNALIGGGFVRGSSTLVVGARGAGKTLLGLQFAVEGARAGEPALFVSFRETADQLLRKASSFVWAEALETALDNGMLTILRTPPIELRADVVADSLLTLLDGRRAQRLVVDEIGTLERALVASGYVRRFPDFFAALVEALRLRDVTSVLTRQVAAERRPALADRLGPTASLSDNLLWLDLRARHGHIQRSLVLLQTAFSSRSDAWHAVTLRAPEGLAVTTQPLDSQASPSATTGEEGDEVDARPDVRRELPGTQTEGGTRA